MTSLHKVLAGLIAWVTYTAIVMLFVNAENGLSTLDRFYATLIVELVTIPIVTGSALASYVVIRLWPDGH